MLFCLFSPSYHFSSASWRFDSSGCVTPSPSIVWSTLCNKIRLIFQSKIRNISVLNGYMAKIGKTQFSWIFGLNWDKMFPILFCTFSSQTSKMKPQNLFVCCTVYIKKFEILGQISSTQFKDESFTTLWLDTLYKFIILINLFVIAVCKTADLGSPKILVSRKTIFIHTLFSLHK